MKYSQDTTDKDIRVAENSPTKTAYSVPKLEKLKKLADVTGAPKMTGNWQAP